MHPVANGGAGCKLARKAIAAPQFHLCHAQNLLLMPSSKNVHLHAANILAIFSIGNISLALLSTTERRDMKYRIKVASTALEADFEILSKL